MPLAYILEPAMEIDRLMQLLRCLSLHIELQDVSTSSSVKREELDPGDLAYQKKILCFALSDKTVYKPPDIPYLAHRRLQRMEFTHQTSGIFVTEIVCSTLFFIFLI